MANTPVSLDKIKIFADGASVTAIVAASKNPRIGGFTTNPGPMWSTAIGRIDRDEGDISVPPFAALIPSHSSADNWCSIRSAGHPEPSVAIQVMPGCGHSDR